MWGHTHKQNVEKKHQKKEISKIIKAVKELLTKSISL